MKPSASNPPGRRVKIADLEDNMDIRRNQTVTPKDIERFGKHLRAWHYLNADNV